jgi:hypothetical protein
MVNSKRTAGLNEPANADANSSDRQDAFSLRHAFVGNNRLIAKLFDSISKTLFTSSSSLCKNNMKALFFLILTFVPNVVWSQSCNIPQPLTKYQKEIVKGVWCGHYELDNVKTAFTVSVDFDAESNFVEVSNPPVKGNIEYEEYRFCGAGAFHFKKVVPEGFFEFDGVPQKNFLNGTLVLLIGNVKKTGKFSLEKKVAGK